MVAHEPLQRLFRCDLYCYVGVNNMRHRTVLFAVTILGISSLNAAERGKGLQLKDLPVVVQKAVRDNLQGAEIKHISKEKEFGVPQYEVETMLGGKARDFNVDSKGALLVIESAT